MGELLAISALVLFSVNIIVTKIASARVDVALGFLVAVAVNVAVATAMVLAQMLLRPGPLQVDGTALLMFILAGFFSTYLGRWLLYDSVVRLGPSRASVFQSSNPMFTALIAYFALDERLYGIDLLASAAILLGLVLANRRPRDVVSGKVVQNPSEEGRNRSGGGLSRLASAAVSSGGVLALLGALSYAVGNVLRAVAIESWNEPVIGVLVGAVAGLLAYSLLGTGSRNAAQRLRLADRSGVRLFIFSGALTVVAQACMVGAMRSVPVSIVTLITLSTPVLVLPIGYFILQNRERVGPSTVFGSIVILAGIATILLT